MGWFLLGAGAFLVSRGHGTQEGPTFEQGLLDDEADVLGVAEELSLEGDLGRSCVLVAMAWGRQV